MTELLIFESASKPASQTLLAQQTRVKEMAKTLGEHGFIIKIFNQNTNPNRFKNTEKVAKLLERSGEKILPVTVVHDYIMITERYPTNEEIRQILKVPETLIAKKPHDGTCCVKGLKDD